MALILAEVGPQLVLRAVHALGPLLLAHQVGPGRPVAHFRVGYSAAHQPCQCLAPSGCAGECSGNHLQGLIDMSCSESFARSYGPSTRRYQVYCRPNVGRREGSHLSYTSGQLVLNQEGSKAAPDCPALLTTAAELQLLCTGTETLTYLVGTIQHDFGESQVWSSVIMDLCITVNPSLLY